MPPANGSGVEVLPAGAAGRAAAGGAAAGAAGATGPGVAGAAGACERLAVLSANHELRSSAPFTPMRAVSISALSRVPEPFPNLFIPLSFVRKALYYNQRTIADR